MAIDGSAQELTNGYICGKVRRFDRRLYGDYRLLRPAVRQGPKGRGQFTEVDWDEALDRIVTRLTEIRDRWGGEAILPFSYGGSNGLLSQDTSDAALFRRLGASRLARTVCAAATGAAAQALYGKMPSVTPSDYAHSKLIVIWGANPSATGIHLVPYVREAQRNGALLVVVDPRRTPLAALADLHLPVRPGTDLPVALALHRYLFSHDAADVAFLDHHSAAPSGSAPARNLGRSGAPRRWPGWTRPRSSASPSATRPFRPPSFAAGGAWSATATAAARRWPCWRCPPWRGSSASGAAATR